MKEYICVTKCLELDEEGIPHCKATDDERRFGTPTNVDFCPCGNNPVWEKIESEGE